MSRRDECDLYVAGRGRPDPQTTLPQPRLTRCVASLPPCRKSVCNPVFNTRMSARKQARTARTRSAESARTRQAGTPRARPAGSVRERPEVVRRGRPPRLSREQIARAALELADREGVAALSMQRVAE